MTMKNLLPHSFLFLLFLCVFNQSVSGQEEMKPEKVYKNTVRLNITNPVIFGDRALVLGYERLLDDHRSISINIGQAQLPKFNIIDYDSTSLELTKSSKEKGFNVTADYRFYLLKLNKKPIPQGVYLGPYVGYATMGRENTWNMDTDNYTGEVVTETTFRVMAIGAELGYQFVLWKRLSLDLVLIGPGLASYSLKSELKTELTPEDEELLFQKINDYLTEKFPGYGFALDDGDFEKTGNTNTTTVGYRYVLHIGYRF